MKNFQIYLLFVLAFGFLTTSCEKEESLSKTELLTIEEGWILNNVSSNLEELGLVDLILLTLPEADRTPQNEVAIRDAINLDQFIIEECEADNVLRFNANKTITHFYGSMKCDDDEPSQQTKDVWVFNADETELTFDDGTFQVLTLNSSTLELKTTISSTEDFLLFIALSLWTDDLSHLEFSDIHNVEGYEAFSQSEISYIITLKAN